jgi:hypothetical protein
MVKRESSKLSMGVRFSLFPRPCSSKEEHHTVDVEVAVSGSVKVANYDTI